MNSIKSLFIISLAFAITLALPAKEENNKYEHCYKPCPSIYLPVCGYDGYKHHLFASECDMEVQNCVLQMKKSHVYMKTALHKCEESKCNSRCTKEYEPICAFDGEALKTFSNTCLYNYENCMSNGKWIRLKSGRCEDIEQNKLPFPKTNCKKICTLDYRPVCGTNGKELITYGNLCQYQAANCNADFHLRLLKDGEC